jgi:DNA repair protein RadC
LEKRDYRKIPIFNKSLVHPREVFAPAIELRAASLIVAHNHPNGQLQPSEADIEITKRLTKSADILGIELLDHLIITKQGYFSFEEEGLI